LERLAPDIAYLTGSRINHPALTSFEVVDRVRIDKQEVDSSLRQHDCGQLEIKKRGVDHRLIEKFSAAKYGGSQPLVLILTRIRDQHIALVCRRVRVDA
ncbi:MAG: THUMP-like domain-containing protein, partial [Pirellulaceae bacterium]